MATVLAGLTAGRRRVREAPPAPMVDPELRGSALGWTDGATGDTLRARFRVSADPNACGWWVERFCGSVLSRRSVEVYEFGDLMELRPPERFAFWLREQQREGILRIEYLLAGDAGARARCGELRGQLR